MWKRRTRILLLLLVCSIMMTGCRSVRLTVGTGLNNFAKAEGEKVGMDIFYLLMAEKKYTYEKIFNNDVWAETIGGKPVLDNVKTEVKDTIAQILVADIVSKDYYIEINDDDQDKIKAAAAEYMAHYDTKPECFTVETVEELYRRILLAERTFYSATKDVDMEVSADEARKINVQYVFLSTLKKNSSGEYEPLSVYELNSRKKQAEDLLEQIKNGRDMVSVAKEYSDDSIYTMELGRYETEERFEDAAFELETGELSKVVETDNGFYIIRCTNDNIDNDFSRRKEEIILKRRANVFSKMYAESFNDIIIEYNNGKISKADISQIDSGCGKLYEIYKKYFVSTQ